MVQVGVSNLFWYFGDQRRNCGTEVKDWIERNTLSIGVVRSGFVSVHFFPFNPLKALTQWFHRHGNNVLPVGPVRNVLVQSVFSTDRLSSASGWASSVSLYCWMIWDASFPRSSLSVWQCSESYNFILISSIVLGLDCTYYINLDVIQAWKSLYIYFC